MHLQIDPLSAPLGAIVRGWQPEIELDANELETLRRALRAHLVLVFRGQPEIADLDLIHFASRFGELLRGSEFLRDAGQHPEILPVTNELDEDGIPLGTGEANAIGWHSDYSYVDRVGKESFLNAVVLPEHGPRTSFCDQYRALETLPPATVEQLRGLRAFHSVRGYVDGSEISPEIARTFEAKVERDRKRGVERPVIPEATHPVVVRHPESGRELLYVSPQITRHIVGLDRGESDALLEELHRHSTRSECVYDHAWETGDLVVFDTLGTMHKRDAWDGRELRSMRQLSTVCRLEEDPGKEG